VGTFRCTPTRRCPRSRYSASTRPGAADRWEQNPETGKWQLTRDRWHTGFVDALGVGGLLGQVEVRTVGDGLACLSTTPLTWRDSIDPAG